MESYEDYIIKTKGREYLEKKESLGAKFAECGALGMTFEEHSYFGTPPAIQFEYPDKTLADLMSDDEILDLLRSSAKALARFKNKPPDVSPNWDEVMRTQIEHMKRDMRYLKKIGRLPKEFENFDVDAIPPAEK